MVNARMVNKDGHKWTATTDQESYESGEIAVEGMGIYVRQDDGPEFIQHLPEPTTQSVRMIRNDGWEWFREMGVGERSQECVNVKGQGLYWSYCEKGAVFFRQPQTPSEQAEASAKREPIHQVFVRANGEEWHRDITRDAYTLGVWLDLEGGGKYTRGKDGRFYHESYKFDVPSYETAPTPFVKDDQGKNRLDLLPPDVLEEVGKVLTFGAEKYDDENWRKGAAYSRYYAAALRHLFAWKQGNDQDEETGINHLAHAICNLMFLHAYQIHNLGTDDRWQP